MTGTVPLAEGTGKPVPEGWAMPEERDIVIVWVQEEDEVPGPPTAGEEGKAGEEEVG